MEVEEVKMRSGNLSFYERGVVIRGARSKRGIAVLAPFVSRDWIAFPLRQLLVSHCTSRRRHCLLLCNFMLGMKVFFDVKANADMVAHKKISRGLVEMVDVEAFLPFVIQGLLEPCVAHKYTILQGQLTDGSQAFIFDHDGFPYRN